MERRTEIESKSFWTSSTDLLATLFTLVFLAFIALAVQNSELTKKNSPDARQIIDSLQLVIDTLIQNRDSMSEFDRALKEVFVTARLSNLKLKDNKIVLDERGFFDFGSDTLKSGGQDKLRTIQGILTDFFNQQPAAIMIIIGHTDSIPVGTNLLKRYQNNWELSALRAIATRDFFVESLELPGNRFVIAGMADQNPVSTNTTETGREDNRRVELFLTHKRSIGKN